MLNFFSQLFGSGSNNELKAALADQAFLVDVRTPAEFAGGSVPTAVNIPLNQVARQLDKFKGKKNIVVFCRSGNRSNQAKGILAQNGFTNVIDGGTWQNVNQLFTQ